MGKGSHMMSVKICVRYCHPCMFFLPANPRICGKRNTMLRKSLETLKCLWCAIWVANPKVEKVFDLCLTAIKGQYGAIKRA